MPNRDAPDLALELALQNYIELETLVQWETMSKTAEKELTTFCTVRDELSSDLASEKAKTQSLGEKIATEKADSFKEGFQRGSSKVVEAYLSSPGFQQWQREVASKAVGEFMAS